jgi:hypothetical protein
LPKSHLLPATEWSNVKASVKQRTAAFRLHRIMPGALA